MHFQQNLRETKSKSAKFRIRWSKVPRVLGPLNRVMAILVTAGHGRGKFSSRKTLEHLSMVLDSEKNTVDPESYLEYHVASWLHQLILVCPRPAPPKKWQNFSFFEEISASVLRPPPPCRCTLRCSVNCLWLSLVIRQVYSFLVFLVFPYHTPCLYLLWRFSEASLQATGHCTGDLHKRFDCLCMR